LAGFVLVVLPEHRLELIDFGVRGPFEPRRRGERRRWELIAVIAPI
jgi:hypothetical protein